MHLQTGLAYELSAAVLRHLLRLPLDYFEKRRTGDLLSRFGATDPIRDMLTEGVMSAAVDGVMAILMGGADLRLQRDTCLRRDPGAAGLHRAAYRAPTGRCAPAP